MRLGGWVDGCGVGRCCHAHTAGSFDAVSSCFVLSGLPSQAAQLAFVARCGAALVEGGRLCLLVNNPDAYGERFTSIQLDGPPPRGGRGSSGRGSSGRSSGDRGSGSRRQEPARRRGDLPAQGQSPPPLASRTESRAAFSDGGSAAAPAVVTSVEVVAGEEEDDEEEEEEEEAWEPGRVCKATFFDAAGCKAFACNDRWWPR